MKGAKPRFKALFTMKMRKSTYCRADFKGDTPPSPPLYPQPGVSERSTGLKTGKNTIPTAPTSAGNGFPSAGESVTTGKYWISSPSIGTGQVNVMEGLITLTPPIWRRFMHQRAWNLINWLAKSGEVRVARL